MPVLRAVTIARAETTGYPGGNEKRGAGMSRAFVFPGQGAQAVGMGRALAGAYPAARAVFDEVDAALGEKLSALIWEGDAEVLTLTQNAQPALMATSMAAMRALEAEGVAVTDRRPLWRGIRWGSIRRSARRGR